MGFTLVLEVLCEIDRGHAASAEFPLNGVAVGEGSFEAVKGVWHQGLRWGVRAQAASGPQQVMRYLTRAGPGCLLDDRTITREA